MEVILSILLHLAVIVSPGEYYVAEIDAFEDQNQQQVDAIRADQALTQQIVSDYADEVEYVLILDYEPEY